MSAIFKDLPWSNLIIIVPHIAIGIVNYFRTIFSLNRFRGCFQMSSAERIGFGLCMMSALVRWITSMSVLSESFAFQLFSGTMGSVTSWASFVVIYNNTIELPSRQQFQSLLFVLTSSALWEVVSRLMMDATEQSS